MKHQRGIALSGLIFWGIVIALVAVLGMKVVPAYLEYFKVMKDAKAAVNQVGPEATVPDVKRAFDRFAEIDMLDFKGSDLEITKNNGRIVVMVAYERRIPLFSNVSLLLDFQGTTAQ